MKIIEVTGIDKAGKHTLVENLHGYLTGKGYKVKKESFPRYATVIGNIIYQNLTQGFTEDKHTFELYMTLDKQGFQRVIDFYETTEEVDYLLLDRYTMTQRCYAYASGIDQDWANSLQQMMRQPDLTIFVDIPVKESMERKGKHNEGENDMYESNEGLLEDVRRIHKQHVDESSTVVEINGHTDVNKVYESAVQVLHDYNILEEK